jgi:hypothetical protein
MTKTFHSKIGLELLIPIALVFAVLLTTGYLGHHFLRTLAISAPVLLFILPIFLHTYYTIEDGRLLIRCGFFFYRAIDIQTIQKIVETNNLTSSPAPSLDRLELFYAKYDSIMVSPKDKAGFIQLMTEINPKIKTVYKKPIL